MSIKRLVKQVLIEKENRRYEKLLREKQVRYSEWIGEIEEALARREEQVAIDDAGKEGDFVIFCMGRGVIARGAVQVIGRFFRENPSVQLLYGDEDVWEGGCEPAGPDKGSKGNCSAEKRRSPWFKPDYSPDLLESYFYFGSLVALRRELFEKTDKAAEADCPEVLKEWRKLEVPGTGEVALGTEEVASAIGKVVPETDEAASAIGKATVEIYVASEQTAYQNRILHGVALAGGFRKGCTAIGHVPRILFHCESEAEQEKFFEISVTSHGLESREMVSVVIPSKDNPRLLEKCLAGCQIAAGEGEEACPYEIVVVDNGSTAEKKQQIEEILENFKQRHGSGQEPFVTYLYEPMEFNFSRMCNLGAEASSGKYLLFLNDDVELCASGCLERMAALAGREYSGAVGMKLYYPDSIRIQHAGITNLPMGPVHKLQFLQDDVSYYYHANRGRRNALAVTAACMMVEKRKFREAGGFSEELKVAFNDVDFCFTLYELGYHNLCMNDIYAYHHESLSRGADESAEKLKRLLGERAKLYLRHPDLEGVDPYYPELLNREGLDTRIRPGYETARNQTRCVDRQPEQIGLADYREDACLMVRLEDFRENRAVGYAVVLGDNNACYEKKILFASESENKASCVFAIPIEGQYRPDLAENMADQVNVALAGFDIKVEKAVLPDGKYRIGAAARNRVTGMKLVNWTNRYVEF